MRSLREAAATVAKIRAAVVLSAAGAIFFAGCYGGGPSVPNGSPQMAGTGGPSPAEVKAESNKARASDTLAGLIRKVEPSVVRIDVKTGSGSAIGSGIVVSAEGLVVTNFHVIVDATEAEVRFHDGRKAAVVGILASDEARDIAVVKVDKSPALVPATLRNSLPEKGGFALALGTPQGLSFSATEGIVSAIRPGSEFKEIIGESRPGTWIQTSASISGGNSGGPLFDRDGAVQGMNTFRHLGGTNLNFAISSVDVVDVVESANASEPQPLPLVRIAETRVASSGNVAESDDLEKLSPPVAGAIRKIRTLAVEREESIRKLIAAVEGNREAIRAAMLAGDEAKAEQIRADSRKSQNDMRETIAGPFNLSDLDPADFSTGEVGYLKNLVLHVVQVLDKSTGSVLVRGRDRAPTRLFQIHGLDVSDSVDGDLTTISPALVFVVLGTETYSTVSGGTNTVYALMCIGRDSRLSGLLKYDSMASEPIDPTLTPDEQAVVAKKAAENDRIKQEIAKAKAAEEAAAMKARQEQERKLAEAEMATKAEAEKESKLKRAGSSLELAKKLAAKGKTDAAREMLDRVIEDAKGTDIAKQAERILRSLK